MWNFIFYLKEIVKKARAIEEHDSHLAKYQLVDVVSLEKSKNSSDKSEDAAPITITKQVKCYKYQKWIQ